jgi:hypothetical protein
MITDNPSIKKKYKGNNEECPRSRFRLIKPKDIFLFEL